MKKKFKKRLKADELIAIVNKSIHFFQAHVKQFLFGAVGLAIIFLIFLGVKYIQSKNIKKESQILGNIIQVTEELQDNPEKLAELEELGGTGKFTRLAYINAAVFSIEKSDFDKAMAFLEKIPEGRKDIIYYQGQHLKAQIYSMKKEYDKALEVYKKIEEEDPADYSLDAVMFNMAEIYEEKGEIEQALMIYNKIKDDFPQTYYGYEASQAVQKLEDKK
jgi:tetratricopeptide (TPR) repeat protein